MKLLDVICEELGVEVNKDWLGSDGKRYKILECGNLMVEAEYSGWLESDITKVIRGEIKPMWKPIQGECYYIADVTSTYLCDVITSWDNSEWEGTLLKRGIVFKTEDEAVKCAKKMLEAVK